jgi:bacteriocin biosynthesis cyclodehydratase domain-containing protein
MRLDIVAEAPRLELQRIQLIETDDGIVLKRGRVTLKIEGDGAAEVVRTVLAVAAEGPVTREALCEGFPAASRAAVDELLRGLEARRILVPAGGTDAAPTPETPLDVFYWHFDKRVSEVVAQLDRAPIAILGVNEVSRQLAWALAASGATKVEVVDYPLLCNLRLFGDDGTVTPAAWPAALAAPIPYREWAQRVDPAELGCLVATSDFGSQALLRPWNEYAVTHGCHFLPVVLQDLIGYVGPLVVPGQTACLECARARQNAHLADPETARVAEPVAFAGQGVNGFHPAMASILGDLAAIELTKFYGGLVPPRAPGRLLEVNLLAPQLTERPVLKVPRCAVCGPLRTRSPVSQDRRVFVPGHPVEG